MARQFSPSADQEILRQAELERARLMRQSIAALWAWLFASRQTKRAAIGPVGAAAE